MRFPQFVSRPSMEMTSEPILINLDAPEGIIKLKGKGIFFRENLQLVHLNLIVLFVTKTKANDHLPHRPIVIKAKYLLSPILDSKLKVGYRRRRSPKGWLTFTYP